MKKVIGITGGIASGKSTAVNYIREKGFVVIDADEITHNLYIAGQKGYKAILNAFGREYVKEECVDRKKLSGLVFENKDEMARLDSIMHPIIIEAIKGEISKFDDGIIFLDIPLLFEASCDTLCDKVVVIYVTRDMQIKRLINRNNMSQDEALRRIEAQMPIDKKKDMASYVINNMGSIDDMKRAIDSLLEEMK